MGKSLKTWRNSKGLSQEKLAQLVGVTTWSISRYETEGFSKASFETVMKIVDVLDIELSDLIIEEETK